MELDWISVPQKGMKKMHIILNIEDDASIAKIQSDFLKINGFDVTIKADGLSGLNEALSGQYDLSFRIKCCPAWTALKFAGA